MARSDIFLSIFDRTIKIVCNAEPALAAIESIYAPFRVRPRKTAHLECRIDLSPKDRALIYRRGRHRQRLTDLGDLIFLLDKDVTIELQRQRHDLYFIHAGVVAFGRSAAAFVAPSGTGKSTTIWALLCHGMKYVSDELMPFDIDARCVLPYPRALCLKAVPAAPYSLPPQALHVGRFHYVPIRARALVRAPASLPLRAIFFLERTADGLRPKVTSVNVAEAAARLYANTLNALAHPGLGLDAAMRLARLIPCYRLRLGRLTPTVDLIRAALAQGRRRPVGEAA